MRAALFALVVVQLTAAAIAQNSFPTLTSVPVRTDPRTNRLVDEFGREVYFHGANVVVKSPPWIPDTSSHWDPETTFDAKDMSMMQTLGLNAIRLGTMWPGVEPTRGKYNLTYVRQLFELAKKASTYGIYSLLDMHQDVMSEKFCGEGVPLWAAQPNTSNFPFPMNSTPMPYNVSPAGVPSYQDCHSKPWMTYYFTEAAGQAFQNWYTNYDGIRDSWVKFWGYVARHMTALQSAVLGFELINEPWAGDAVQAPELLIPGVADQLFLQPMYDAAVAEIRKYDSTHAVFFEPVTWDDFGSGFTHVPGGKQYQNLSVLAYHFYIPPDFSIPVQFSARVKDQKRLGCAGMLTEFSVKTCAGCGDVEPVAVMDACDDNLQSWLFWELKPFKGFKTGHSNSIWFKNGTLNTAVAYNVSRTYAQIVAGETTAMKFDTATSVFHLSYTTRSSIASNVTQIFISEQYHYPAGFNVTVLSGSVTWQRVANNTIQIVNENTPVEGGNISIRIAPK